MEPTTYTLDGDIIGALDYALRHSNNFSGVGGTSLNALEGDYYNFDEGMQCTMHIDIRLSNIRCIQNEQNVKTEVEEIPKPLKTEEQINEQMRNAAHVLMQSSGYPAKIKDLMRKAWSSDDYQQVMDIAASHDVVSREQLDDKITQLPNPNFALLEGNVREVNPSLSAEQISPYLFKAEGIKETFTSASDAVAAYKMKNKIAIPDSTRHSFRKNHIESDEGEDNE